MGKNLVNRLNKELVLIGLAGSLLTSGCQTASDTNALGTGTRIGALVGVAKGGNPLIGAAIDLIGGGMQNQAQIQGQQESAQYIVSNSKNPDKIFVYMGTTWVSDFNGDKFPDFNEIPLNKNPKRSDSIYLCAVNIGNKAYRNWKIKINELSTGQEQVYEKPGQLLFGDSYIFQPYSFSRAGDFNATFFVDKDNQSQVPVGSISFKIEE